MCKLLLAALLIATPLSAKTLIANANGYTLDGKGELKRFVLPDFDLRHLDLRGMTLGLPRERSASLAPAAVVRERVAGSQSPPVSAGRGL